MRSTCEVDHSWCVTDLQCSTIKQPRFTFTPTLCCPISFQLSMKNLSDIAKKMEDDAGVKTADSNVSTSASTSTAVRLHGGVNFISLDIDDAATLVSTLNAALPILNSLSSPALIFYVILLFIPRTP